MRVAVDASNLVSGGGLTHLENFLGNLTLPSHGFTEFVVWCAPHVAEVIDKGRPNQRIIPVKDFTQGLYRRHRFRYGPMKSAIRDNFDVFFSPGGLALNAGLPQVVMSRNLQPFQRMEILRHLPSYAGFRLLALRFLQGRSFTHAEKVIFLNDYVADLIGDMLGIPQDRRAVVPHGVSGKFRLDKPRAYERGQRVLYVSTFNSYKHQLEVISACASLRAEYPGLTLSLVGGQAGVYGEQVLNAIAGTDSSGEWISAPGKVGSDELAGLYRDADVFVFASSCENLPNILLEAMSSGLPVACSNVEPMPSVLKDAGVYFNPRDKDDLYQSLRRLLQDADLRRSLGERAATHARAYTWEACVDRTLAVLRDAALARKGGEKCAE